MELEPLTRLLHSCPQFMKLKIFVDSDDIELKQKYIEAAKSHNNKVSLSFYEKDQMGFDAGFDLFCPISTTCGDQKMFKMDHNICCAAKMTYGTSFATFSAMPTGYYLYPRSSIIKTPFRMANSVGIIDAPYRGHIIAAFDILENSQSQTPQVERFNRYAQICAPGLIPIYVEIVETKEQLGITTRGDGGFGSTGV
jgi:dUTP pyrophosphatase